jgi:23S rRNA pseudouridine1911/1915/1917 synthase
LLHVVTADESGKRTDVIVAALAGASRARVAQAVKRGSVSVNDALAKGSHLLEEGDLLEFEIGAPDVLVAGPEAIDLAILYEDEDVIVVDKPAGMITHPARGATSGTLVNALLGHVERLPGDALRPGLVHRLDRDTSGLLVVAKNEASLRNLAKAMKAREIQRKYLGLVHGVPQHARGTIDGPIGRDPHNRLKLAIAGDGKPAITHYELRKAFPKHAELLFTLETGRTHQIRVHLAAIGHAILNDPLYGHAEARFELPGQALHAWRVKFRHPRTGAAMEFEAEPPREYLQARTLVSS